MTGVPAADYIGLALGGCVLARLFTGMMLRVAPRIGYVDHLGAHKSHARVMPYGGGVAIMLAGWLPALLALAAPFVWPSLVSLPQPWGDYAGGLQIRARQGGVILGGALVLHVLGLIDDRRALGPFVKLIVIAAVAAIVPLAGGVRIATFAGPAVSLALSGLWIIIIVNAMNFLDNMDGLAGGVFCISVCALIWCGLLAGQVLIPALGCLLVGVVAGFLMLNFPPARIFMGDAGSLVLGYFLAVLSMLTTYYQSAAHEAPYMLAMPVVVLAVPLYDFASVVVIRILERRNPLRGDQRHFSHRLVLRGLSRRGAVLTIYLATAATGLAATLLPHADLARALTVVAIVGMILGIIAILEMPLRDAS